MGMFDSINCERTMPDGYVSPVGYQSKDLDCDLDTYTITDDGRLLKSTLESPGAKEVVNFHGWLHFYNYHDGESHLYDAKFTDGKLVEIKVTGS